MVSWVEPRLYQRWPDAADDRREAAARRAVRERRRSSRDDHGVARSAEIPLAEQIHFGPDRRGSSVHWSRPVLGDVPIGRAAHLFGQLRQDRLFGGRDYAAGSPA